MPLVGLSYPGIILKDITADQRADRLIARQYGLIALAQARAAGLTERQVRNRLCTGRWAVVVRGLFRSTSTPITDHQRLMAAVLAGPPGTVASHLSAAWLYGAMACPRPHHVIIPPGTSGRRIAAAVHRIPLSSGDRATVARVPATIPAVTVADAAALLQREPLADLVGALIVRGVTTPDRILRAQARRPRGGAGCSGNRRLTEVVRLSTAPIAPESPAEAKLLRRLAAWGFTIPVTRHEAFDGQGRFVARLDLAWISERVAVEYDGMEWHTARRIESDEAREAELEALGWEVVRADRADLAAGQVELRGRLDAAFARQAARFSRLPT